MPDPRKGNHLRHTAHDMFFGAIIAVLCGYDSYRLFSAFVEANLDWFRAHGCPFAHGIPSHDAFYWLFRRLDPSLLSACLGTVASTLRKKIPFEIVAIDGKGTKRAVLTVKCANVQVCKCANGQLQFPVSVSQPTLAMPVLVLTIGNCPLAHLHICTFAYPNDATTWGARSG